MCVAGAKKNPWTTPQLSFSDKEGRAAHWVGVEMKEVDVMKECKGGWR